MKRNEVKQKNVMFGLDPDIQVVMESMFDLDPRMSLRSSEDDGKEIKQELLCLTLYTFFGVRGF